MVIPRGLLGKLQGKDPAPFVAGRTIPPYHRTCHYERGDGFRKISWLCSRDVGADKFRFIEVKGRQKGADTVTVTKNEILCAFNKPDKYILAIVEVDGEQTQTSYLKKPFRIHPDFAATSVTYNIAELTGSAEIV
ncbi:protein NO VEIN domain-containing protein [Breznakiellaceae bacterium SP9]